MWTVSDIENANWMGGTPKIRQWDLTLEGVEKLSNSSNLNTNVSHKDLYTMGLNIKKPYMTKGLIKKNAQT